MAEPTGQNCEITGNRPIAAEHVTKGQVLEILQKHYPYATLREEHAMHRAVQEIKALNPVEAVSCSGLYDKEETYANCTVQVLTNTVTGEVSIGWMQNDTSDDLTRNYWENTEDVDKYFS